TLSATLSSIEAGTPALEGAPSSLLDEETPLQSALRYGFALRLTYSVRAAEGAPILYLFEGPANVFGAYLRGTAHWASSARVTLNVAGRAISGWRVTGGQGISWILFELDGTLIAVDYPSEESAAVITRLWGITGL